MCKQLTNIDHKILDFIKSYITQYGYPPSYGEIGEGVKLYSKSSVHSHIQKLIYLGELEIDHPGSPRAIRLKQSVEQSAGNSKKSVKYSMW